MMHSERKYSFLKAKEKIEAWCAYQDRCHYDVNLKLISFGLDEEDRSRLISHLISYDFLNEQRFADAFVSGKVRIKKWGRVKIKQHLKAKQVPDRCVSEAMKNVDMDEYLNNLKSLAQKKSALIKDTGYLKKQKIAQFLYGKGYESDLIQDVLKEILND